MKVPPKRKGNSGQFVELPHRIASLNESPSEKEGKSQRFSIPQLGDRKPSMKVPPKRKGNNLPYKFLAGLTPLNESPSEKEGKFEIYRWNRDIKEDPQ